MANDNIHWPKRRKILKSQYFEKVYEEYGISYVELWKMRKVSKSAGFVKGRMTEDIHWPNMRKIVKSEDFERVGRELWYKLYDMNKNEENDQICWFCKRVNDKWYSLTKSEENCEIWGFWKSRFEQVNIKKIICHITVNDQNAESEQIWWFGKKGEWQIIFTDQKWGKLWNLRILKESIWTGKYI